MTLRHFATTHTITRLAAALLAAGGLLAGLIAVHPAPAAAAGDCTVPAADISLDSAEQSLLTSINSFRQQNGRAALSPDATLNKVALWASRDDVKLGQAPANHIDSLGRGIEQRLRDCGYTTYTYIAENNYWGYGSNEFTGPDAAMNFWTNSPPHRANLLDARAKFIGIARVCDGNRCFYTLDFGSDAGPAGAGMGTGTGTGTGTGGTGGGTGTGTGTGTGGAMSRPVLQFGSQGQAVRELQTLLGRHGYAVTVDGDFGPQTATAVRAFQKAKGLVVDGVVGPQTWGALLQPPVPSLRALEPMG